MQRFDSYLAVVEAAFPSASVLSSSSAAAASLPGMAVVGHPCTAFHSQVAFPAGGLVASSALPPLSCSSCRDTFLIAFQTLRSFAAAADPAPAA